MQPTGSLHLFQLTLEPLDLLVEHPPVEFYLTLAGAAHEGATAALPLEVLFRARVWRRPRRLVLALAPGFVAFVAWDLWKSTRGTWGFAEQYTVGLTFPGGMVVEELVFFTVIPVCALLSLETVRRILRRGPGGLR